MKKIIKQLVNPHILTLTPYQSARGECAAADFVLLDANENPLSLDGDAVNRYPDPLQQSTKIKIGKLKQISPDNIFLGNGSDEIIDLLIRIFCTAGKDQITITPPTFGMYSVAASINNIEIVKVDLTPDFQLDYQGLIASFNENSKMLFLCSPNNPSSNKMDLNAVRKLIIKFPGIVVLDEAYAEFCPEHSLLSELGTFTNLIILQTFSKAWGLAAARLGVAFADREIIEILNKIKMPYNINALTLEKVERALLSPEFMQKSVTSLLEQRKLLEVDLAKLPNVVQVFPSDANFLLVKFTDASKVYQQLKNEGLLVRQTASHPLTTNCLRISVGTPEQNRLLISALVASAN